MVHDGEDVAGVAGLIGDDEVGMNIADVSGADAEAFEAATVDELAGGGANLGGRIFESTACGMSAQGLRGAFEGEDFLNAVHDGLGVVGREFEDDVGDDFGGEVGFAVGEDEVIAVVLFGSALGIETVDIEDGAADIAVGSAGVHTNGPPYRGGDSGHAFEA